LEREGDKARQDHDDDEEGVWVRTRPASRYRSRAAGWSRPPLLSLLSGASCSARPPAELQSDSGRKARGLWQEAARPSDDTITDPAVRPAVKINGAKARSALDLGRVHEAKIPRSHTDETGRCSNDLLVSCMIASRHHGGPHEKDPGGAARHAPYARQGPRAAVRTPRVPTPAIIPYGHGHSIPSGCTGDAIAKGSHALSRPRRRRRVHGAWPPA
jgi:hypothetical protein